MNKFASDLKSKKVILRQEGFLAGEVKEVVINPENGAFLGFVIKKIGQKKPKVLPEKNIIGINNQFILVDSEKSLGEIEDIVRIKRVRNQKIPIIKNKVYTLSNIYLGRVSDFTVNLIAAKISRLYVQPGMISRLTKQHIIDSSHIIAIKKNYITVDDAVVSSQEKTAIRAVSARRNTA